jgi:oligopeptide transport system substrate-binding protein
LIARAACVAALCLLGFPGCARREPPVVSATKAQTLLLGNGAEPEDLDPQVVTAYTDQNILLALFEGLTAVDEKDLPAVAAAAQSWEVSADGLSWTFHLREGTALVERRAAHRRRLRPVVAADALAGVGRRIREPPLPHQERRGLQPGTLPDPGALGLSAPGPEDRPDRARRPDPVPPASWSPCPRGTRSTRVLERFGALSRRGTPWTRPGNLVGNGPFTLEEWTPNARIVVARNPYYWNAAP